jgi:hypothetical protein
VIDHGRQAERLQFALLDRRQSVGQDGDAPAGGAQPPQRRRHAVVERQHRLVLAKHLQHQRDIGHG